MTSPTTGSFPYASLNVDLGILAIEVVPTLFSSSTIVEIVIRHSHGSFSSAACETGRLHPY